MPMKEIGGVKFPTRLAESERYEMIRNHVGAALAHDNLDSYTILELMMALVLACGPLLGEYKLQRIADRLVLSGLPEGQAFVEAHMQKHLETALRNRERWYEAARRSRHPAPDPGVNI